MKKIIYALSCAMIAPHAICMQLVKKPAKPASSRAHHKPPYEVMLALFHEKKCTIEFGALKELETVSQEFKRDRTKIGDFVGEVIFTASLDRSRNDRDRAKALPITIDHIRECWIYEAQHRNDGQAERFEYFKLILGKRGKLEEVALLKLQDIVQRSMGTQLDDLIVGFIEIARNNHSIKKEKAKEVGANAEILMTAQDLENAFNGIKYTMDVTEL